MFEIAAWAFLALLCVSLAWFAMRSSKQWRLRTSTPQSEQEVLSKAIEYARGSDPGEAIRLLGLLDQSPRTEVRIQAYMLRAGIYCERTQYGRAVAEFEQAKTVAHATQSKFRVSKDLALALRRAYVASGKGDGLSDWEAFMREKSSEPRSG